MYRAEKWLYFLIDFCYFANLTCILGFLLPKNVVLLQINFTFATGPLAWAIVAWRNSLVFHSIDKITSVYIHAFPLLLTFCIRWFPDGTNLDAEALNQGYSVYVMLLSVGLYLLWQVLYFLKTEMKDRAILDSDPQLMTSLRWLARDSTNVMHILVLNVVRKLHIFKKDEVFDAQSLKTKLIFMASQLVFTFVTILPSPLLYHSFFLHTCFICFVFFVSTYNGANYYFEVFTAKYPKKFEKKD